jgi:hypothetical protein
MSGCSRDGARPAPVTLNPPPWPASNGQLTRSSRNRQARSCPAALPLARGTLQRRRARGQAAVEPGPNDGAKFWYRGCLSERGSTSIDWRTVFN